MKNKNNLKSVDDYAKLCGVSKTTIYKRIDSSEIHFVTVYGVKAIDITKYPPKPSKRRGRRKLSEIMS